MSDLKNINININYTQALFLLYEKILRDEGVSLHRDSNGNYIRNDLNFMWKIVKLTNDGFSSLIDENLKYEKEQNNLLKARIKELEDKIKEKDLQDKKIRDVAEEMLRSGDKNGK